MNLEEERDNLRREVRGLQEMLYQVLYEVGEPVLVPCDSLKKGLEENKIIAVDLNEEEDVWVFSLVEANNG